MFRPRSSSAGAADIALLDEVERTLTTGEATGTSQLWLALAHSLPRADDAYRSALSTRMRQAALDAAVREAEIELEFVSGWEIP